MPGSKNPQLLSQWQQFNTLAPTSSAPVAVVQWTTGHPFFMWEPYPIQISPPQSLPQW